MLTYRGGSRALEQQLGCAEPVSAAVLAEYRRGIRQ
jgi:hypothetical protein